MCFSFFLSIITSHDVVDANPATIVVPDDFLTIQEAINNAADGDTVFVRAGTYIEHVVVNKTVALVGESVETTVIDGNYTGHVFHVFSSFVNVTGFKIGRAHV
jgi:nitrous oxidase accessory protein NosD